MDRIGAFLSTAGVVLKLNVSKVTPLQVGNAPLCDARSRLPVSREPTVVDERRYQAFVYRFILPCIYSIFKKNVKIIE